MGTQADEGRPAGALDEALHAAGPLQIRHDYSREHDADDVCRREHQVDDRSKDDELGPDREGCRRVDELRQEGDEEYGGLRVQDLDDDAPMKARRPGLALNSGSGP